MTIDVGLLFWAPWYYQYHYVIYRKHPEGLAFNSTKKSQFSSDWSRIS